MQNNINFVKREGLECSLFLTCLQFYRLADLLGPNLPVERDPSNSGVIIIIIIMIIIT